MDLKRESRSETLAVEIDGLPARATVVRSARRRRTIAISVDAGSVLLRAPMRTTKAQLLEALVYRRQWILARLAQPVVVASPQLFRGGEVLPYRGAEVTLEVRETASKRGRARLEEGRLVVEVPAGCGPEQQSETVRNVLIAWYRMRAAEVVAEAVGMWSARTGLVPSRVFVREQKRRWGSCGPDGVLRFNWRLVMVEQRLLEHVVVHELVHLRHRNHQAEFWAEVSRLLPDHRRCRRELNALAASLPL